MGNQTPELRSKAKELLKKMGGTVPEEQKPKWLVVIPMFIVFGIYIPILLFAPMWAQVLATVYVIYFLIANIAQIAALFKK